MLAKYLNLLPIIRDESNMKNITYFQKKSKNRPNFAKIWLKIATYTVLMVCFHGCFNIGEMAEWLKAPLSKSGMGETSSRVQIPLSPQKDVV